MDWGGFLLFNALCDAISGVGEHSKCPRRGTKEYKRAAIGSVVVIILGIVAIIAFFVALSM